MYRHGKFSDNNLIIALDRYNIEIIDLLNRKMLEKNKVMFIVSFKKGVLMKKFTKIACAIMGFVPQLQAYTSSHTFFTARQNFQKGTPERQSFFRSDLMETCCTGWRGAFQVVVYGGKTTNRGDEKLTKFFLPQGCGDCTLNFQEYKEAVEESLTPATSALSSDYLPSKNVEARNFNIVTNNGVSPDLDNGSFSSSVQFKFSQSKLGIGLDYKQQITVKKDGTTGFWVEGAMPIERIRNKIDLREKIHNNGGGAYRINPDTGFLALGLNNLPHVDSVKAAFIQQKLLPKREVWGLCDVELLVGYNTYVLEWATTMSYFGLSIPTGTRVRGISIFEPIAGSNRCLGLLFGNETNFNIYRKFGWEIDWILEWNGRYLLQSEQIRSIDPVGKPWGRFLETYSSTVQANKAFVNSDTFSGTFGNDSFRHCVKVSPSFQGILNQAFNFNKDNGCWRFITELGYNLFARQAEEVELLKCNPVNGVYFKGIDGRGTSTTARTIKADYPSSVVTFDDPYYTRTQLTACDLNLESAAHPAVISQTLYASAGVMLSRTCPAFFAIGASYEFQHGDINTALERWLVWAKLAMTF